MAQTSLPLPPMEVIDQAAISLIDQTDDASRQRAINKAQWYLHQGISITTVYGGFLIPSGSRPGLIHRISHTSGCDCEASCKGRTCWHSLIPELLIEAQRHTMPALTDRAAALYRQKVAQDALDECF